MSPPVWSGLLAGLGLILSTMSVCVAAPAAPPPPPRSTARLPKARPTAPPKIVTLAPGQTRISAAQLRAAPTPEQKALRDGRKGSTARVAVKSGPPRRPMVKAILPARKKSIPPGALKRALKVVPSKAPTGAGR